jgi:exonuclease SbcC
MKLQKLIIHNIASIADATIDFEHGVLSEEPLFLICGDTGTGKSTILNCICMALFNMVPSMPSPKGSYKFEDTTVGNPANLMRRGTGEASINLFFSEDDKSYEVDWIQRRARNKADGRFQPLSRILKDIETGETLASKEVSEKIEEIIGLDYTRFTRMFLLAQGQFNKFLSANDNDKSQILESLTSLDIYKGIGVYIHDRSAKEKEVFDRIKQRIEDIHLLTDEEKEAKSKEMNDDLEEIGKLSVQRTILEGKLNWRKSVSENQKAAEEAKSHIDAAKLQVESEENQNRMVLLQLWDSTGDLRSCKTLIASLKDSIKENKEKLQTNRTVFLQYRMGLDQSKKKLEELQEQLKEKESDLKQLSLNHDTYENVQTILAAFKTISNLESSNTTLNQKIHDNVEKSKQLDLKISDAEKNYKQKLADETSCKTERDKKQQEFDDSGKEKLQAQYNQLQTEVTDITSGKGKWQLAKNASVAVAEKQEEITTTRDELAKLTKQQEAAEKSSVEKDDLYNKCKEACDLRKLTIDECSQKLRQSLEDGKPCPICGSVHHEVKEEKFFEDLYDQANEELAKAQKEKDDARNSWMRLQAQTKEKENGLKIVSEKLLPQLQNKLDGTMKDWEPFAEKFAKNVAFDEADILLENEEKSRRVKLIELGESLKAASQLEKELDALRQKYETAQSLTATAKKTYDDLLTDQKTLVHDNETYQSQIEDNKTSVQTSIDTVNDWMTDEDWMLSWNQDRVLYEKRLKEAAKKYQDYTSQIPLLKKSIEQKAADIRQSDEEITKMITLLPDWDKADELCFRNLFQRCQRKQMVISCCNG